MFMVGGICVARASKSEDYEFPWFDGLERKNAWFYSSDSNTWRIFYIGSQ